MFCSGAVLYLPLVLLVPTQPSSESLHFLVLHITVRFFELIHEEASPFLDPQTPYEQSQWLPIQLFPVEILVLSLRYGPDWGRTFRT